ncbi:MAG TPA: glycosyltransferase family 9 protein [Pyrinomonadaceae bacterium]
MSGMIDWSRVRRVLVVRLRSIGDTVLSTPSLIALKRFLPDAEVDILLEDWVAPVLDGFVDVDNILTVAPSASSRLSVAYRIRRRNYDVVFNLHGGTTATFLTFASGARHRVGYRHYQYAFLHNNLIESSTEYWKRPRVHSVEQQLAMLGSVGVPIDERQRTRLEITDDAARSVEQKISQGLSGNISGLGAFALLHPAAAFATKQWSVENFAAVAQFLRSKGLDTVAVAARNESATLRKLQAAVGFPIRTFDDLTLPEITALATKASLFVGNDSGIAHIAAAVGTPSVVIFGSSNRDHWSPWTDAPNEVVYEEFLCQPCPGHECREFGEPRCILSVKPEKVFGAIDRILK